MKRIALGVLIAPPIWIAAYFVTAFGLAAGLEILYRLGKD